ncbi:MAG: ABC transporter permease [Sphingobacteriales bacterium]|jgi:ABC-2 type transport system permease protein|nr:ABC transporter permease [Sphingobacteriales bacterium]
MKKIALIISREYLSRVKKKSFIIMTFLGPILIGGMYAIAIWLAVNADEMNQKKNVYVIDETEQFKDHFRDSKSLSFQYVNSNLDSTKKLIEGDEDSYVLYIPNLTKDLSGVQLYSTKQASISVVSYIEKEIESELKDKKLVENGISRDILKSLDMDVSLNTIRLTDKGEESGSAGASFGIGMFASVLIYLFIFLYGVQVMRGVIEEKNNRIVEVIISSVKPFQLMMGKIIGIALVGLTQFVLWVVLTTTISGIVTQKLSSKMTSTTEQTTGVAVGAGASAFDQSKQMSGNDAAQIMDAINTINFPLLIGTFIFYFLGGYLLYSALFAAIGSAVDNESETQQFMFPVTIPLIFSFVLSSSAVANNPDGPIAFWMSMIPLTSPIVMMVRIPFGVPVWQLVLSMVLLILGFMGTVWVAAKIYRTGILMYGKKVTFKELYKWLRY